MVVVVNVAKPMVEATYLPEGNGPLALIAYDQVMRVKRFFELHKDKASYPDVPSTMSTFTTICCCELPRVGTKSGGHIVDGQMKMGRFG